MKKYSIIRILASLLILAILISKLNLGKLQQIIFSFPLIVFLLMLLHYFSTVLLNSSGIFILIRRFSGKLSFRKFLPKNWFSISIGQFSPARSGEGSIVFFLNRKYHLQVGKLSASFILFKMLTLVTLFLFTTIAVFLYLNSFLRWYLFVSLFFLIGLGLIVFASSYRIRIWIRRYILRKYAKLMKGFYREFLAALKDMKTVFYVLAITAFKLILNATIVKMILSILSIHAPLLLIVGINSMVLLISLVPISFSGIGLKESAAVALFAYLGYDATIIAGVYLMLTTIYLIVNSLVLMFFNLKA